MLNWASDWRSWHALAPDAQIDRVAAALEPLPIFRCLRSDLPKIARAACVVPCAPPVQGKKTAGTRPGRVLRQLFKPGDMNPPAYVVLEGLFRVARADLARDVRGERQREDLFAYRGRMSILGVHCCIDGLPHGYFTEPLTEAAVIELPALALREPVQRSPEALLDLLRVLHIELEASALYRERMAKLDGKGRIALLLFQLAVARHADLLSTVPLAPRGVWDDAAILDTLEPPDSPPNDEIATVTTSLLTRDELARQAGLNASTRQKAFDDLCAAGAIETPTRRTVVVRSLRRLHQIVEESVRARSEQ